MVLAWHIANWQVLHAHRCAMYANSIEPIRHYPSFPPPNLLTGEYTLDLSTAKHVTILSKSSCDLSSVSDSALPDRSADLFMKILATHYETSSKLCWFKIMAYFSMNSFTLVRFKYL